MLIQTIDVHFQLLSLTKRYLIAWTRAAGSTALGISRSIQWQSIQGDLRGHEPIQQFLWSHESLSVIIDEKGIYLDGRSCLDNVVMDRE